MHVCSMAQTGRQQLRQTRVLWLQLDVFLATLLFTALLIVGREPVWQPKYEQTVNVGRNELIE